MSVGLDAFLAEVVRTAEAEEARIRAEAEVRANTVLHDGREAIARRREAELSRIAAEEQRNLSRETASVERATRLAILEARAHLMATIFAGAKADLVKAEGWRYLTTIPVLVEATLPYLEGRPSTLRCRPDVAAAVQGACASESSVEVCVSPDCEAGVLGQTLDGDILVDSRLISLLARRREDLAIRLAQRLETC